MVKERSQKAVEPSTVTEKATVVSPVNNFEGVISIAAEEVTNAAK